MKMWNSRTLAIFLSTPEITRENLDKDLWLRMKLAASGEDLFLLLAGGQTTGTDDPPSSSFHQY